jgi:hypothetical protein
MELSSIKWTIHSFFQINLSLMYLAEQFGVSILHELINLVSNQMFSGQKNTRLSDSKLPITSRSILWAHSCNKVQTLNWPCELRQWSPILRARRTAAGACCSSKARALVLSPRDGPRAYGSTSGDSRRGEGRRLRLRGGVSGGCGGRSWEASRVRFRALSIGDSFQSDLDFDLTLFFFWNTDY